MKWKRWYQVKFIYNYEYSEISLKQQNQDVRNSQVTESSYKTELSKMVSHFELLTQKSL